MPFKKGKNQEPQHVGKHQKPTSADGSQSKSAAGRYSRDAYGSGSSSAAPIDQGAFKPAYTPSNHAGTAGSGAGAYSRNNPEYSKRRKKAGRGKKIALGIVIAVAIALVGGGIALASYVNGINNTLKGNKSSQEIAAIDSQLTGTTTFDKPFNVMLIGSDVRLDGSVDGARSDTNIIVRVDPKNKKVSMVSIPRDTMIQLDDYGTSKFNAAYAVGGVAETINQAKKLTGVDIDHYAEIDFDGLVDLVDAVGGVDVYVDSDIDDPDAGDVTLSEGEQHLDGESALVYARTRQYVDGDYTRVEHQRTLIAAIVNKIISMPASQLPDVVKAATGCVATDMTVNDILSLAQQIRGGSGDLTIYSATLPSTTAMVDGVSYVVADSEGIKQMMEVFNSGGDPSTVGLSSDMQAELASALGSASSGTSNSPIDNGGGVGGNWSDTSGGTGGYSGYAAGGSTGGTGGYSNESYGGGSGYSGGQSYGNGVTQGSTDGGYSSADSGVSYGGGTGTTGEGAASSGSGVASAGTGAAAGAGAANSGGTATGAGAAQ